MHIVKIYLNEMVVDFLTSKFGEVLNPDKIKINHGHEALFLKTKINEIAENYHIPRTDRNKFLRTCTKEYSIYLPTKHITPYQNRLLDHVFRMYFKQELAWSLLLSKHVFFRDKVIEFCEAHNLQNENDIENIEKIAKCKRKRICQTTSISI
jgi:hypothetical protein